MSAKLAITCGLPRSGKTTFARKLQAEGWVRLCPDDIRRALHGRAHYAPAEALVWAHAQLAARALLTGGHSVVVDATHVRVQWRQPWVEMARDFGHRLEVFVLNTSAEECHRRNETSEDPVPPEVIDRMAALWEPVEEDVIVHHIEG